MDKVQWLTIKEAQTFCLLHNYDITKQGLWYIATKYNWFEYDYACRPFIPLYVLKEHIFEIKTPIPNGWHRIYDYRHLAKNTSDLYNKIKKEGIETRYYTRKRNLYARETDIIRIFTKDK